jgi:hypothetical protein
VLHAIESISPHGSLRPIGNSLAHTKHSINLLDAKPVKDIGHQCLKAHILHARNVFGSFEVLRRSIKTPFAGIIDEILPPTN